MEQVKTKIGGKEIIIETGKLAKQAGGAVTVRIEDTIVLVTVVAAKKIRDGIDFFPLTVDYKEKTYAAGKIPGGFFKREGRPSEKEILTCRLIDRPIRPLFPKGFLNEVQIMGAVLSHDGENDPDILAIIGASAALAISDIPFLGPVGAVRVGSINDEFILNPTYAELEKSSMNIVVVGSKEGILMLEAGIDEISEKKVVDAIMFGYAELQRLIDIQQELVNKAGKDKSEYEICLTDKELKNILQEKINGRFEKIYQISDKHSRKQELDILAEELISSLVTEDSKYTDSDIKSILEELEKDYVRDIIINKGLRPDNRKFDEIRNIDCEVGLLPRVHGSALFTRGQTQSLSAVTLGTSADEQRVDALEGEIFKNFMLHYNFPPFSVGEVKPVRGPGRREIGHGALAERALKPILPPKEKFPYTIRLVSDILESNGSSSMATVCAGTLSLMNAGVPIKKPVSGIAMGLVAKDDKYAILTDIAGIEDHCGDMDFKVTGTEDGITAVQLDVKIKTGLNEEMLRKTLEQAKDGRLFILDKMQAVINKPNKNLSEFAPKLVTFKVKPEKIGAIIGPGGKIIRKIIEDTGASINIDDDGTVVVGSVDQKALEQAVEAVKSIVAEPEVGKIYDGIIRRITNFGAFCEFMPGKDGLIHVSELANGFIEKVESVVNVGDEVKVKVIGVDDQGRVKLSMRKVKGYQ